MRLIKMIGLAAVAAMAAMAFVGATSASAGSTQLCASHTSLTCGSAAGYTSVTNEGQGVGRLLSNLATILCLLISALVTPLALGNPQQLHISKLIFSMCGTNSAHTNCEVEVLEQPLFNLLKTGLDAGTIEGSNGETLVDCQNIDIFGTDIECTYDATGLQFSVGGQHMTASETPVTEIGSDFLCPNEPTLDGLLVTTDTDIDSDEDADEEDEPGEDTDVDTDRLRYVLA